MTVPYEPRFPELLDLWRSHDLAFHEDLGSIRPWFYEGLRPEDELLVWKFIEDGYLLRFKDLIGVRFEWSAGGLWRIPFPGSVSYGEYLQPDDFGMPEDLVARIREWHNELDRQDPTIDPEDDPDFDYEASRAKGLVAAKGVKPFLGDDYYVEYRPFREIVIVDDTPVELEVPEFITDLTR
jgi:hypothetical protein